MTYSSWLIKICIFEFAVCLAQDVTDVSGVTQSTPAKTDRPYKGRFIGKFREVKKENVVPTAGAAFKVSGSVYAVDDKLLFIDKFTYDGGISGQSVLV